MKEVTREVTKIEKIVEFVSFDGKVWDNKDDCKKWEESYEGSLTKMWNQIPKTELDAGANVPGWNYDDYMFVVSVRDENDVKVINAWTDYFIPDSKCAPVTYKHIGHDVIIVQSYYDSYGAMLGTIDEFYDGIKEEVKRYAEKKAVKD